MDALVELLGGEDAIARWLTIGTLVAARVAPLTLVAPWLAMRAAPVVLRTAVTLALTAALTPLAIESAPEVTAGGWAIALLCAKEALVGACFAVASSVPLFALDWAGRLVDTWRGAGLAEVIAPPTGERTSPLGDLGLLLGVAVFVVLGGHRVAIAAFAEGLAVVPIGAVDVAGVEPVAYGAARLVGSALTFAAALAAPAAAAIVTTEVALGLVSRAAPQIPVFFAGMPLRAAVGIAASLLALSLVVDELPEAFRQAIAAAARLIAPLSS